MQQVSHAYTKQHGSKRPSTYNISKLGIGILTLDPRTVCVRVEEEGGHVTLGAVRVLVLLSLLALRLDLNGTVREGINFVTITHGWIGEGVLVVYCRVKMKNE